MKRLHAFLVLLFCFVLPLLAEASTTQIVRADYGVGTTWVDVTSRVRSFVHDNSLSFPVTNKTLGVDPRPGQVKMLRVYIIDNNGSSRQLTFKENEYVNLRLDVSNSASASGRSGQLAINHAQYGAGSRLSDVTARLNSRIQGDQLNIEVTNDNMGGDPAKGDDKTLNVQYTYNGKPGQMLVKEGDTLRLPPDQAATSQNKLQVLHAEYGAGSQLSDVTARLKSKIQDNQLKLQVTNDNMGGDPAKGQDKTLNVQYIYNGKTSQVLVNEGDTFRLPAEQAATAATGKLQVLYAEYGAGNRLSDVTSRLVSQIQDNQLKLQVTTANMGGDPAPGQVKTLTAQYSYDGKTGQAFAKQGDTLSLPLDQATMSQNKLQILHAEYGAGNRLSDVTTRLSSKIQSDRLDIPVTNDNMGGDPAKGTRKNLTVQYAYNARQAQIVINENEFLRLPVQPASGGPGTYTLIPSGTQLSIRTNELIDSKTSTVGQKFSAVMHSDVLDKSGTVAIPKGSDVQLVIRSTAGSDLVLDIDSLVIAGQRYAVSTSDLEKKGREGLGANVRTAEMVGGGAAVGAVIGAIVGGGKGAAIGAGVGAASGAGVQVLTKGPEVRVPAETVLNFKLDQDLRLNPVRR